MGPGQHARLNSDLGRIFAGDASPPGDRALLAGFVGDRDEAAFEALVARHGPMVRGICRRILPDGSDADDAFQATFVILFLRAGRLGDADRLGPWLFGVATRVAIKARARVTRRRAWLGSVPPLGATPAADHDWLDVMPMIDAEMHNITPGDHAPEFDGMTLDGQRLKLTDYRGKVVVLVFCGSWCGPCLHEIPHERELATRYRDRRFALVGVNCRDRPESARQVVADQQISWRSWHDGDGVAGDGPIVSRYHIRSYPTAFVIDALRNIRHKGVRGASLDAAVANLLDEMEPKAP